MEPHISFFSMSDSFLGSDRLTFFRGGGLGFYISNRKIFPMHIMLLSFVEKIFFSDGQDESQFIFFRSGAGQIFFSKSQGQYIFFKKIPAQNKI